MGAKHTRYGAVIVVALAFAALTTPAHAYELDVTFGGDGIVTTNGPGSANDQIDDLAVLSSGKVLAAGFMNTAAGARDFALARYNTDGSLDPTFAVGGADGDGVVTTDVSGNGGSDIPSAVAVQGDGKIVVAGDTLSNEISPVDGTAIVRYEADGTLDTNSNMDGGFGDGDDGITILQVSSTGEPSAEDVGDMAIDGSGRIVVAGGAYYGPTPGNDFFVARLTSDGALDAGFDGTSMGNGIVTVDFTAADGADGDDEASAVGFLDDGDILAAGSAFAADQDPSGNALARLNSADGTLDTSFDGDGKVTTNNSNGVSDIAISTGKVLAVGGDPGAGWNLTRYNQSDGGLDMAFGGGDGVVTTVFDPGDINAGANAVVIDGSTYVVAGFATAPADPQQDDRVAVARYLGTGTLDVDFGGDGTLTTNNQPPAGTEVANAVGVIDDGNAQVGNKVVIGGRTQPDDDFTHGDWLLERFGEDSTPATSRITKPGHRKTYKPGRIRTFTGTASDPNEGSGVDEVEIALRRRRTNGNCAWFDGAAFVPGDCAVKSFEDATPAAKRGAYGDPANWTYGLPSKLKPTVDTRFKDYTLYSRGTDVDANVEDEFEAKRNANRFEVR